MITGILTFIYRVSKIVYNTDKRIKKQKWRLRQLSCNTLCCDFRGFTCRRPVMKNTKQGDKQNKRWGDMWGMNGGRTLPVVWRRIGGDVLRSPPLAPTATVFPRRVRQHHASTYLSVQTRAQRLHTLCKNFFIFYNLYHSSSASHSGHVCTKQSWPVLRTLHDNINTSLLKLLFQVHTYLCKLLLFITVISYLLGLLFQVVYNFICSIIIFNNVLL